jgi:outer membrane protein TolC
MKTRLILLCAYVFLSGTVWAQTTLDINSAVAMALEKNLALERVRMEAETARRRSNRSWNSFIPTVSAGAFIGHPTSIVDQIPSTMDVWTPGLSLSATLQFSPALITNIRRTKEEYEAGLISYQAARQELEFQVRRLYYQLLLLQANVAMGEQNVKSAQDRYAETLVLQRVGQASNLDELTMRLDVQTQGVNLQNAKTAYDNALDSFRQLLMIPQDETIILQGSLEDITLTGSMTADIQHDSLEIEALRKSIRVFEIQKRALQTEVYAPNLNFSWNTNPVYTFKSDDWTDNSGQFSITLSFKLDNFLPWSSAKEQIDSLNDTVLSRQNLLQETVLNHRNTIQNLERNITQSIQTIETLHLNITLAQETYAMSLEAYRKGVLDLQGLNSAQDKVSMAQNQLLSEHYSLVSVLLELEKELDLPFGSLGK